LTVFSCFYYYNNILANIKVNNIKTLSVDKLLFMKPLGSKTSLISFDKILEESDIFTGSNLADLGCGNSVFFLYSLATITAKNGKVFGVDIQPSIIETIKREISHHSIEGVFPVLGNLDQLRGVPLDDNILDRAFLINTLHQSSDIISMLGESKRLLKKNGQIIIIDWDMIRMPLSPHIDRQVSQKTIEEACLVLDLKIIKRFKPGKFHYGLILANKN